MAFCLLAALMVGCATAPKGVQVVDHPDEVTTIQEFYADRLARLRIGMSIDEFHSIMPEAYVGGQNGATTAYEVKRSAKYVTQDEIKNQNIQSGFGSPSARTEVQVLWFYFYSSKLVQWGLPKDWPERPEQIIEIRDR